MRALKVLVIGMGVLILGGLAVVIATIVARMDDETGPATDGGSRAPSVGPAADGPAADAFVTPLPLPEGCRVADLAGAGGVLALRLAGPVPVCDRVLLVDPASGRLTGTLRAPMGTPPPPRDRTQRGD